MTPVLLLPLGLAALAALALPLLVHLARRQQQRPTVFAALRWLQARPRPRRQLRFDEPWLLAVRLLLVALVALLLARPALQGVVDARPRLLAVPGIAPAALAQARARQDVEARWLAPGFPPLDVAPPSGPHPLASLLREFDAQLPAGVPLTVLVPARFAGADGGRLRLAREVDWRVVEGEALPATAQVQAPVLAVRHDDAHRDAARYLRAAAIAWRDEDDGTMPDVAASTRLPAPGVTLAWLHAGQLPPELLQRVEQGAQALLAADAAWPDGVEPAAAWRDDAGQPLLSAARLGQGRLLRFERALAPAEMPQLLAPEFPHVLRELLQPPLAPTVVGAVDYAPEAGAVAVAAEPFDLRPWLALAIALLALLERWLATSRRREEGA